jgi:hypothetical protein
MTHPAPDVSPELFFRAEDFESRGVYDRAQCYRHAPVTDQPGVAGCYGELLEEIAKAANAKLNHARAHGHLVLVPGPELRKMQDELARVRAENGRFREALEFYADRSNWVSRTGRIGISPIDTMDREAADGGLGAFPWAGGKRARAALTPDTAALPVVTEGDEG